MDFHSTEGLYWAPPFTKLGAPEHPEHPTSRVPEGREPVMSPCIPLWTGIHQTKWGAVIWKSAVIHAGLVWSGAHPRGRPGGSGPSPWDPPSTRCLGFILLNYIVCIFAACVRKLFAMWEDRASLQHGSAITFDWHFTPHWQLYKKVSARALPLRKSWVRPWVWFPLYSHSYSDYWTMRWSCLLSVADGARRTGLRQLVASSLIESPRLPVTWL